MVTSEKHLTIDVDDYLKLVENLSKRVRLIWGKTNKDDADIWLPLYIHLSDTAAIAEIVWDQWIPLSSKMVVARSILHEEDIPNIDSALHESKRLYLACAALHDIGKATPDFQLRARFSNRDLIEYVQNEGLRFPSLGSLDRIPHALASMAIVERHGWDQTLSIVLGGHHGKPPSIVMLDDIVAFQANIGFNDVPWIAAQDELYTYALRLAGIMPDDPIFGYELDPTAQIALTGMLIMADWLASDEYRFPYFSMPVFSGNLDSPYLRASSSWSDLGFTKPWQAVCDIALPGGFLQRFDYEPRPVQEAVLKAVALSDEPGLMIIEAPMGEGKTEAALAAAEILAAKCGCGGVFVAMPTQATSDGLFPRILKWIRALDDVSVHSMNLVHGKAQFNSEYQKLFRPNQIGLDAGSDNHLGDIVVNDWFRGRNRGVLSDFVVGTIDQILMGGLKKKHLALRHLALINKVVVIDECHAYDAYMSSYLYKVLNWLGSYKVPTVVLSATLPKGKRKQLVDAYLGCDSAPITQAIPWLGIREAQAPQPEWVGTEAYPLVTYTDSKEVCYQKPKPSTRKQEVVIHRLEDNRFIIELKRLLSGGGCAGVIVNTVARAQLLAKQCMEVFGTDHVVLLHAQYIASDRLIKEELLRDQLGPPTNNKKRPSLMVVIGTQVLEQSLDIDFDVLFTDICPMDLLIQRVGRLHRHMGRERPQALERAICYMMGITGDYEYEKGSEAVYGKYLLMNSDILLPEKMMLPYDIEKLVQSAYAEEGLGSICSKPNEYRQAKDDFEQIVLSKQDRAKSFQIGYPGGFEKAVIGWLDAGVVDDLSGKRGEATVRDTNDSIEVLVIQRVADRGFCLLPWVDQLGGASLPYDQAPSTELAMAMARCSVRLPSRFCMPWAIDRVIRELEQSNIDLLPYSWQESEWIEGELFLVLDDSFEAILDGRRLRYSRENGLSEEGRVDGD